MFKTCAEATDNIGDPHNSLHSVIGERRKCLAVNVIGSAKMREYYIYITRELIV
jgi:hypothetical protein